MILNKVSFPLCLRHNLLVTKAPESGAFCWSNARCNLPSVRGHIQSHYCEPSICRSRHLRSTIMARSLLHRGSGMITGSSCATGIERFNASSSSQRALVSFARTLLLSSWPKISLPSGGRKPMACCMTVAGSPNAVLCAWSQPWWTNLSDSVQEIRAAG